MFGLDPAQIITIIELIVILCAIVSIIYVLLDHEVLLCAFLSAVSFVMTFVILDGYFIDEKIMNLVYGVFVAAITVGLLARMVWLTRQQRRAEHENTEESRDLTK